MQTAHPYKIISGSSLPLPKNPYPSDALSAICESGRKDHIDEAFSKSPDLSELVERHSINYDNRTSTPVAGGEGGNDEVGGLMLSQVAPPDSFSFLEEFGADDEDGPEVVAVLGCDNDSFCVSSNPVTDSLPANTVAIVDNTHVTKTTGSTSLMFSSQVSNMVDSSTTSSMHTGNSSSASRAAKLHSDAVEWLSVIRYRMEGDSGNDEHINHHRLNISVEEAQEMLYLDLRKSLKGLKEFVLEAKAEIQRER